MEREELAEWIARCRCAGRSIPPAARRALRGIYLEELFRAAPGCFSADSTACLRALGALLQCTCRRRGMVSVSAGAAPPVALSARFLAEGLLACLFCLGPGAGSRVSLGCLGIGSDAVFRLEVTGAEKPPILCRPGLERWASERGGVLLWSIGSGRRGAILRLPRAESSAGPVPDYSAWAFDRYSPLYSFASALLWLPD